MVSVQDKVDIIRAACAAWRTRDVEKILSFFAQEGVFHNMPSEPLRGRDAVRGMVQYVMDISNFVEFRVLTIAGDGNLVLVERLDVVDVVKDGTVRHVELPCMNASELDDNGLILSWRDYYDQGTWNRQVGDEDAHPPAP